MTCATLAQLSTFCFYQLSQLQTVKHCKSIAMKLVNVLNQYTVSKRIKVIIDVQTISCGDTPPPSFQRGAEGQSWVREGKLCQWSWGERRPCWQK